MFLVITVMRSFWRSGRTLHDKSWLVHDTYVKTHRSQIKDDLPSSSDFLIKVLLRNPRPGVILQLFIVDDIIWNARQLRRERGRSHGGGRRSFVLSLKRRRMVVVMMVEARRWVLWLLIWVSRVRFPFCGVSLKNGQNIRRQHFMPSLNGGKSLRSELDCYLGDLAIGPAIS